MLKYLIVGENNLQHCVIDLELRPTTTMDSATDSEIADAALGILNACVDTYGQGGMVKYTGQYLSRQCSIKSIFR